MARDIGVEQRTSRTEGRVSSIFELACCCAVTVVAMSALGSVDGRNWHQKAAKEALLMHGSSLRAFKATKLEGMVGSLAQ